MKLLILIIPIWLIGEVYFYLSIEALQIKESEIMFAGDQKLLNKIPSLANGQIIAKEPAILYDLVPSNMEALSLSLQVEIYQTIRIKTSPNPANKHNTYENQGRFVTKDSDEWNNRIDSITGPNYKSWPIKYQSRFVCGKDFWFRDSLKLDDVAILDLFRRYKSSPLKLNAIYFEAPIQLAEKSLYIPEKDSSSIFRQPELSYNYYYGKSPKNPQVGDIRITLHGFVATQQNTYQYGSPKKYALLGKLELPDQFPPYMGQYIFWDSHRSTQGFEDDLEYISRHYSCSQNSFKWIFRVVFGLMIIALLFSK
ncbi:MAG: hypothetical protein GY810_28090 [Aureispira sp.]|nr:hypothetical protein [Aureispira sp.]